MILTHLTKYRDTGLLLLRVGLGVMFILHGWPKISGGPEVWTKVGGAMRSFNVDLFPAVWGFMAAFAEFGGGILLVLGLLFRPACILLTVTMLVAWRMHALNGDPFVKWSHAAESAIVFFSLLFIGPGRYSVDKQ